MSPLQTTEKPALGPNILPLMQLERARLFVALLRTLPDIARAQEVLDQAMEIIGRRFYSGILPKNPDQWLRRVALRILQERRFANRLQFDDLDPLPLVFAISHPGLTETSRSILSLSFLCGLESHKIEELCYHNSVEEHLARAKRALRNSFVIDICSFDSRCHERIKTMHEVLYQCFRICVYYKLQQQDLIYQIAELLLRISPKQHETMGLLAWMDLYSVYAVEHLQQLRIVERSDWDLCAIEDASQQIAIAQKCGEPGPALLRAQILALQLTANSWEDTDWRKIADLYGMLWRKSKRSFVLLRFAEAVSWAEGPLAGLALLQQHEDQIDAAYMCDATKAEILCQLGKKKEAWITFQLALDKSPSRAREEVLRKMALCDF